MLNAQRKEIGLPESLSKVRGEIVWFIRPPDRDLALCRTVIGAMLAGCRAESCKVDKSPSFSVEKVDRNAIILRCCNESRQLYFKVFLPRFSWRWKRGLRAFTPPAVRQSGWFMRLRELDVGVVDLVGVAVLPWRRRLSPVQPISVMVTSSGLKTENILQAATTGKLSPEDRVHIARTILEYADTLHKNGIGHIDMLAANILYDVRSCDVLLCDLDRFAPLKFGNTASRIRRDFRKVTDTLRFILNDDNTV